jgi:hypothetical protein
MTPACPVAVLSAVAVPTNAAVAASDPVAVLSAVAVPTNVAVAASDPVAVLSAVAVPTNVAVAASDPVAVLSAVAVPTNVAVAASDPVAVLSAVAVPMTPACPVAVLSAVAVPMTPACPVAVLSAVAVPTNVAVAIKTPSAVLSAWLNLLLDLLTIRRPEEEIGQTSEMGNEPMDMEVFILHVHDCCYFTISTKRLISAKNSLVSFSIWGCPTLERFDVNVAEPSLLEQWK